MASTSSPATSASARVQARSSADAPCAPRPRRPDRPPGPSSRASFSSSRCRRCWRFPTCATSARAAPPSSSRLSSRARGRHPFRELPRLHRRLGGDVAAGSVPRGEPRRRLQPALLAREERHRGVRRQVASAVSRASRSLSFQRSTPSTITNRRASAKVIVLSAAATASGVPLALEELDARRPHPRRSRAAARGARRPGRGRRRGSGRRA